MLKRSFSCRARDGHRRGGMRRRDPVDPRIYAESAELVSYIVRWNASRSLANLRAMQGVLVLLYELHHHL
jgi:hypothetical protein